MKTNKKKKNFLINQTRISCNNMEWVKLGILSEGKKSRQKMTNFFASDDLFCRLLFLPKIIFIDIFFTNEKI